MSLRVEGRCGVERTVFRTSAQGIVLYYLQDVAPQEPARTGVHDLLVPAEVQRLAPAIARGTSCPGHVVVPWAHSPIWSRQDPNFVSLIQIASYKR